MVKAMLVWRTSFIRPT